MRMPAPGSLLAAALIVLTTAADCGVTDPKSYFLTLTTAGSGSGTVSAAPVGNSDGAFLEGTVVTITASANAGSDFTGWSELDTEGCPEPKNPCTITMSDRRSVVANFVLGSGAPRYDGLYTGTVAAGSLGSQPINLAMTNGTVQGEVAPLFGSQRDFSGSVTASGAFTATINPGPGSNCAVNLSGTITTSLVDGIMTATLSGSWQVVSTGGIGCGAGNPLPSGSWSASRDRVKVEKI